MAPAVHPAPPGLPVPTCVMPGGLEILESVVQIIIAISDDIHVMRNYTLHHHTHLVPLEKKIISPKVDYIEETARAVSLQSLLPQIPARWPSRVAHVLANDRTSLGDNFMF